MLIPQKIVQRESEIMVRSTTHDGSRVVIYRDGRWYRACIIRPDGMGWDGEGLSIAEALDLVREQRDSARKAGY